MSAMKAALGRKGCVEIKAGKRASNWEPVASTGEAPQEHGAGAKGRARRCTNLELKGPSHLLHPGFSANVQLLRAGTCANMQVQPALTGAPVSERWEMLGADGSR